MKRLLILAAAPLLFAAPLAADCPNAAVNYLQAINILELHEKSAGFKNIDWSDAGAGTTWETLPNHFKATFEQIPAQVVEMALSAKQMDCCNFQLSKEAGPRIIIPHLGGVRHLARVMRLDARGQIVEGDLDTAATRIASLYRMADGVAQDRLIISSLVAAGISNWACQEVDVLLATGQLGEEGRQTLLTAIQRLDDDPFGFRATLEGEQEWIVGWIRREFRGENAGRRLVRAASEFVVDDRYKDFILPMLAMKELDIAEHADRLGLFFAEAAEAWDAPDSVERMKHLEERLLRGEFGFLAPFAPALSAPRQSAERAMQNLQRVKTALSELGVQR
jgi:hypothetical protein